MEGRKEEELEGQRKRGKRQGGGEDGGDYLFRRRDGRREKEEERRQEIRLEVGRACLLKKQGTQVIGQASIFIIIPQTTWLLPASSLH